MKRCEDCKLHQFSKINCILGDGPMNADMLFVGEAPGEDEERTGKPFVGRAGQFQERHVFRGSGIVRAHVRLTNAVRCRPKDNKTPGTNEIRACRYHLEDEIARIKPKVIVLLGNVPLYSVIPMPKKDNAEKKYQNKATGITKWRGNLMWHHKYQCWVMPTFHPSGLARSFNMGSRYQLDQAIADIEAAERAVGRSAPDYKYPTIHLADTPEKAIRVMAKMMLAKTMGFDIETEDLDFASEVLGISMACGENEGFYLTWEAISQSEKALRMFKELCKMESPLKILHNAAFDTRFIRMKGLPFSRVYKDTMIMAHLHDENFFKGLKPLTWRHLLFGGYEQPMEDYRIEHKLRNFKGMPVEVIYPYSGMDAVATRQLYFKLLPHLVEERSIQLYDNVLMPVREVMTTAEIHGFKTDPVYAKNLDSKCDIVRTKLLGNIYAKAGGEFNLKSPKQLGDVLYKKLRLPVVVTSKKGKPSCNKKALTILSKHKKGAIVQDILGARYIADQQTKFIKLAYEGIVNQRYNLTGTQTGRASCSDPGLHNIPKDRVVRAVFVASSGNVLIVADAKSAELRMLAACSGEPALLKAFKEGRDLHTWVYNLMFKKPMDYVPTQEERFIAKAINFGLIYGRGPKSLGETLGCSTELAMKYIDLYFKTFPMAKQFLDGNIKEAKRNGYVETFFRRRRRLPEIKSDMREVVSKAGRQANNMMMQSPAADCTYVALVRIDREIRKRDLEARIIHTVHDCVVVDTPRGEVKEVSQIILDAFSKPIKVVPINMESEVEVEKRWGLHNDSRLYEILGKFVDVSDLPTKLKKAV
jgi:DNA polymerase-1